MTEKFREDYQLARACVAGDRSAQRDLYERYRAGLYRMALRYATDEGQAKDFVHDGLLKVYGKINGYTASGPLGGWVRRVVVNEILQTIRKRPEWVGLDARPETTTEPIEIDEELGKLPNAELYRFIRELPLGYRTVFSLYYLEGYRHAQIATELGISTGASKSQLSKAKRQLRRVIVEHYPHYQTIDK